MHTSPSDAAPGTTTTAIAIDGMSCGHCIRAVQRELKRVPGVRATQVQLGSAAVTHDASVSRDTLVNAVMDAGYDVRGAA
jgi:copper chaperone